MTIIWTVFIKEKDYEIWEVEREYEYDEYDTRTLVYYSHSEDNRRAKIKAWDIFTRHETIPNSIKVSEEHDEDQDHRTKPYMMIDEKWRYSSWIICYYSKRPFKAEIMIENTHASGLRKDIIYGTYFKPLSYQSPIDHIHTYEEKYTIISIPLPQRVFEKIINTKNMDLLYDILYYKKDRIIRKIIEILSMIEDISEEELRKIAEESVKKIRELII
ncbi:MAG: hypothetical protein GXO26_08385 [Crenarchaeota archaeon]|nr:hypothetical protein [Thermoproteota archaeon]